MSEPTLYELERNYEDYDTLSFLVPYTAEQEPAEPPEVIAIRGCYDRKPLSEHWNPPPTVIERGELRTDIYDIESCFAVNRKAKQVLSSLVGPYIEFLPVDVVGERDADADDEGHKPISRPPELYLINPLVEVELGKGSISHEMAYRLITWYVFHPDDLKDLPIFRAKEDSRILISESFRDLVISEGLRGLQFDNEFDWHASMVRAPTSESTVVPKTPQRRVEPPELIPEDELSGAKRMRKDWWEDVAQLWKWACDAALAREGTVDYKLKISKPISERQLATLRKKVGGRLPPEFEHVLTHFARKVSFSWSISDSPIENLLPNDFRNCCVCDADIWDVATLPSLAEEAEKIRQCGMAYFEKAYDRRLPFIRVGDGDHIAFDMQHGTEGCPIVYLSHENDVGHNRVLGRNFVEFLLRWSGVGCVGPDFSYMEAFYDARKKRIHCHGRNAKRWRRVMASGV